MDSYSDLSSVGSSSYSSSQPTSRSHPGWAILCIVGSLFGWLMQAYLVQNEDSYKKELFMLYIRNVVGYTPYLLIAILWQRRQTENRSYFASRGKQFWVHRIKILCPLSIVAFSAGYLWYLSLQHTTVSLNTTIYNANAAVVFVMSVFILKETVSLAKVLAVLFCAGGIVLEAFAPSKDDNDDSSESSAGGVLLVLLSMFLFCIYEVFFKKIEQSHTEQSEETITILNHDELRNTNIIVDNPTNNNNSSSTAIVGNEATANSSDALIVLAIIGFWNLILVPILIIIWHFAGWEEFELPPTSDVWGSMIANAALDGLYNVSLLIGISLSSPLFMAMGSLLSIPISIVMDVLQSKYEVSGYSIGGSVCIVLGFILLVLSQQFGAAQDQDEEKQIQRRKSITNPLITSHSSSQMTERKTRREE